MAGRFPLYTDADVHGPLIKALKKAGWDVVRAIDELPEGEEDPPHFERAVELGRVLVSNDEGQAIRASKWHRARRAFPGLVTWPQRGYSEMTYGELHQAFEEIAARDDPFALYPIIHIHPKR
jgi:hypothetical protein